jgi:two-component system chemotaxis response regulator CheY
MRQIIRRETGKRWPEARFVEASNVDEARRALQGEHADCRLVLLDYHLPGASGMDLISWLRNEAGPALRELPVVVLSAESDRDIVVQALRAGAQGYLVKPVPPERLYQELERYLGDCDTDT